MNIKKVKKILTHGANNYVKSYITHEEAIEFQSLCMKCYNLNLTLEESEHQASNMIMFLESLKGFDPVPLSGKDIVESRKERSNYGNG